MKKPASITDLYNDSFLSGLKQFVKSKKFWIAFSGGMDSSVLLHLFYLNNNKISQSIEVLYINHGLQKEAAEWARFCEKQCQQYSIPFKSLQITEKCPKGESIEAWAREKRYMLIEEVMNENDVFFTGHHQDDQVETFFIQALRGAGVRGLASMPLVKKNKKNIFHARPLLNYSRNDLKYYAEKNKLNWRDDKSNSDHRYDRNYFRHKLAPVIEERWPAYRETISRLINNQKEYKVLLDEIALNDIKNVRHNNTNNLNLDAIQKLSIERQKNLIFFWLKELNLKTPGSKNIEKIMTDIICSSIEKSPCVNWKNVEVRRYKNILYAFEDMIEHDVNVEYKWSPLETLNISGDTIIARSARGKGISKQKVKDAEFIIRYRQGGEKIHPEKSLHSKTVKQLFQEREVLPWLRDRIPLVYVNEELTVIPGFCVDDQYLADKNEPSWDIHWSGYDSVIQS